MGPAHAHVMRRYYSALRVAPYCSTDGLQYAESTRVETGRRPFRRVSLLHSTYVPQETRIRSLCRFAALSTLSRESE